MHVIVTPAGDLISFTAGLLITVLLLVLTLRASRLPGTPLSNIGFAVCALFWSAGGFVHAAALAAGSPYESHLVLLASAVQYSGAAAFPIPILAIWRTYATRSWQKTAARVLQVFACISAAVILILLWSALDLASTMKHVTFLNAALLLVLGAVVSLRRSSTPRAVYVPSLAIAVAVGGASIAMAVLLHAPVSPGFAATLGFIAAHLILLLIVCAFLLFARFRYADVFIRYSVRLLLAAALATVLALVAQSMFMTHLTRQRSTAQIFHVFLVILFANLMLLSFAFVDEKISILVNRWLFHPPDYRARTRDLGETLLGLKFESEIAAALEDSARSTLQLDGARVISIEDLSPSQRPAAISEGELVELDRDDPLRNALPLPNAEWLVPIVSAGRVSHLLLVSLSPARPGLVTPDLQYLRAAAAQCGSRLDALREALLLQQVTEAELSALRAQVNPHFLFNSLNTIADLIVRDPLRAETMTLRLASVFRHVLAHSSRPMTSIRDEIEFLRTYLYIEEARFGDRLRVEIDLAPEVAGESIPSLILQPLVENALKHGLGPKPGPGHLWISADAVAGQIRLRIEDDGTGPVLAESPGLGLSNVAGRLRTLYQDRASVRIEPREAGGTRVTILIPRGVL